MFAWLFNCRGFGEFEPIFRALLLINESSAVSFDLPQKFRNCVSLKRKGTEIRDMQSFRINPKKPKTKGKPEVTRTP
jgi:hypothetical protein